VSDIYTVHTCTPVHTHTHTHTHTHHTHTTHTPHTHTHNTTNQVFNSAQGDYTYYDRFFGRSVTEDSALQGMLHLCIVLVECRTLWGEPE